MGLGRLHGVGHRDATYAWSLQYFQYFKPGWAVSLGWLNEGHLENHHRDGPHVQVWRFHRMASNHLRLGAGVGAYRVFDTTAAGPDPAYHNDHGVRPLLSLRADYPITLGRWGAFAQVFRTLGPEGQQTQAALVGITGRFGRRERDAEGRPRPPAEAPTQEISFLFGRTILNSFESETTRFLEPFALEYRRQVGAHLAWSVAYTDEGGLESAKRDGVSALAWFTTRSSRGTWLLGLGAGPYLTRVFPGEGEDKDHVTVRTSVRYALLLGRDLGGHWGARLQWNRTVTRYHRDTDVLLAGLAYQW